MGESYGEIKILSCPSTIYHTIFILNIIIVIIIIIFIINVIIEEIFSN